MTPVLMLPLRFAPEVSHTDPRYVQGFTEGFVAPRGQEPPSSGRVYQAGWYEGQTGIRVPGWRWDRHEKGV